MRRRKARAKSGWGHDPEAPAPKPKTEAPRLRIDAKCSICGRPKTDFKNFKVHLRHCTNRANKLKEQA